MSVNYSTNKSREWHLALDVSHRWRGGGEGALFFLLLYFSFPDSIVVDATQTKTGDGAQKKKSGCSRRDVMVVSGTESGTATGVQGPDVSIRNYLFFSFFPN